MKTFTEYLAGIDNEEHRTRLEEVLQWIIVKFPFLETKIAWNQPMFTHHGTFIMGFSVSKEHFSIAPESKGIEQFSDAIKKSGYTHGTNIFRIKWTDSVDFTLLERMIQYNIEDKADCVTFWRK